MNGIDEDRLKKIITLAKYSTTRDAIYATIEQKGGNCKEGITFSFYLHEAEIVKEYVKKHGKESLGRKLLCLIAEAK